MSPAPSHSGVLLLLLGRGAGAPNGRTWSRLAVCTSRDLTTSVFPVRRSSPRNPSSLPRPKLLFSAGARSRRRPPIQFPPLARRPNDNNSNTRRSGMAETTFSAHRPIVVAGNPPHPPLPARAAAPGSAARCGRDGGRAETSVAHDRRTPQPTRGNAKPWSPKRADLPCCPAAAALHVRGRGA